MNKNKDQFERIDDATVEFETNLIMNRINNLNEKKVYHKKIFMYPILTVFLITLFISTGFGGLSSNPNPNDNGYDWITIGDTFTIKRVNAHEYKLINYGVSTDIIVHTAVENPNKIKYNNEISYYKSFNKYLDVSEKTDIHLFEIGDNKYMNVEVDERVNLYYEVVGNKNGNNAIDLNYNKEFINMGIEEFKTNIEVLDNMINKYPPIIIEDMDRQIIHYDKNPNSKELNDKDYDMYLWYIRNLEYKANILEYSTNNDDYEYYVSIDIIMDGDSIENIGGLLSTSMKGILEKPYDGWDNPNEYESPIIIENIDKYGSWSTNNIYSESDLMKFNLFVEYTLDDFKDDRYKNKVLVTPIFNFNSITSNLDINDYEINITVNGEQVRDFEYVVSDNIVCFLPIIVNHDDILYGLIYKLPISIEIRDINGDIILSYKNK